MLSTYTQGTPIFDHSFGAAFSPWLRGFIALGTCGGESVFTLWLATIEEGGGKGGEGEEKKRKSKKKGRRREGRRKGKEEEGRSYQPLWGHVFNNLKPLASLSFVKVFCHLPVGLHWRPGLHPPGWACLTFWHCQPQSSHLRTKTWSY